MFAFWWFTLFNSASHHCTVVLVQHESLWMESGSFWRNWHLVQCVDAIVFEYRLCAFLFGLTLWYFHSIDLHMIKQHMDIYLCTLWAALCFPFLSLFLHHHLLNCHQANSDDREMYLGCSSKGISLSKKKKKIWRAAFKPFKSLLSLNAALFTLAAVLQLGLVQ